MGGMFYNCILLTSLNLSNFDTQKVRNMSYMFSNCVNLEYINLKNFDEKNLGSTSYYYEDMFNNVPENIVICINENINKEKIFSQIANNHVEL